MCFAVNLDDYLNVESRRRDLSQMKSTTKKTGFLFITFSETGRLVVQLYVAGRRQRFRSRPSSSDRLKESDPRNSSPPRTKRR